MSSVVDKAFNQLISIYKDVSVLYDSGYRCRFDSEALKQIPLKENEQLRKVDHCWGCKYLYRHSDPYCKNMMRSWHVLMDLPEEEKKKFICTCPSASCGSKP